MGTLYVAASPLGNLGDISHRLTEKLRDSEIVAAEDTRRARKLLNRVDAHPKVLSFHAHSPPKRLAQILSAIEDGKSVVMLTDAGTPTISDPGRTLVNAVRDSGSEVVVIPGPSAVTAALSVSGLPALWLPIRFSSSVTSRSRPWTSRSRPRWSICWRICRSGST